MKSKIVIEVKRKKKNNKRGRKENYFITSLPRNNELLSSHTPNCPNSPKDIQRTLSMQ